MAFALALGAGVGYGVRYSGLDKRVNDIFKARVEASNRRYAAILGEEIGTRIIILKSDPELTTLPDSGKE